MPIILEGVGATWEAEGVMVKRVKIALKIRGIFFRINALYRFIFKIDDLSIYETQISIVK